uniref:Uncharacterized protein n=1 Tax=mine drainage metagenome TaxID=410659 RepID=E6PXU1_9ZZZZ
MFILVPGSLVDIEENGPFLYVILILRSLSSEDVSAPIGKSGLSGPYSHGMCSGGFPMGFCCRPIS